MQPEITVFVYKQEYLAPTESTPPGTYVATFSAFNYFTFTFKMYCNPLLCVLRISGNAADLLTSQYF